MAVPADRVAREMLEVVPVVMGAIRSEIRRHQESDLTLAEYRVLVFLRGRHDVSLSALADNIGLGLPSMSKMVDRLVDRGLVSRTEASEDRRRLALCLTEAGTISVESAVAATQEALACMTASLGAAERQAVFDGLRLMRSLFMRAECVDEAGEVPISRNLGEMNRERYGLRDERAGAE